MWLSYCFHSQLCEPFSEVLFDLHLRESKTVLDSGFQTLDSGFQILDFGFQSLAGFRTPKTRIPDSTRKKIRIPAAIGENSLDSDFGLPSMRQLSNEHFKRIKTA